MTKEMSRKRARMLRLSRDLRDAAREIEDRPLLKMSGGQRDALNYALRKLDLSREYGAGFSLRRAFGVEVDNDKGHDEVEKEYMA